MNEPKRHHWWPESHQSYWADSEGRINAVRKDGTCFRAAPKNIAVIGEHNTVTLPDGSRNRDAERYLAKHADGPASQLLKRISDGSRRVKISALKRMSSAELVRWNEHITAFGFEPIVDFEYLVLRPEHRRKLADYIASMIVRVPSFRSHASEAFQAVARALANAGHSVPRISDADQNRQVEFMLSSLPIYAAEVSRWTWVFLQSSPSDTFIFSDSPVKLNQPAGLGGGLSDIAFPLLPTLMFSAMDGPRNRTAPDIHVMRVAPEGVRRFNRNAIGLAQEQLFLAHPPDQIELAFILDHFGVPAPKDLLLEANASGVRVSMVKDARRTDATG